jgi:hypothetical protein
MKQKKSAELFRLIRLKTNTAFKPQGMEEQENYRKAYYLSVGKRYYENKNGLPFSGQAIFRS